MIGTVVKHTDNLTKYFDDEDRLINEDRPTVINSDGYQEWFLNGLLHNIDGPARVCPDGTKMWYRHGKLHRIDGPAVVDAKGKETWYQYGKLHRTDGPALVFNTVIEYWYYHGRLHRTNGPAVVSLDLELCEWWINNQDVTDEVEEWMEENHISWPFDAETEMQFKMRWL